MLLQHNCETQWKGVVWQELQATKTTTHRILLCRAVVKEATPCRCYKVSDYPLGSVPKPNQCLVVTWYPLYYLNYLKVGGD